MSTMAGTCPHCGIKIAGNLKQCPNCNEYCQNSQDKCPHCGTTLSVVTEEAIEQDKNMQSTKTTKKTEKKSNKSLIFSISIATLLVLIIGGLILLDYKNSIDREEEEFARLEDTSNPEYYNDFHPSANLPPACGFVKYSRGEIEKFMNVHPYSIRKHVCEDMIDSIDWNEAKKLNTEEAIVNYLNVHPSGRYAEEASLKKNELGLMKITAQDKAIIRGALENFFTVAMSKQDISLISEAIIGKMENFCGTPDATPEQMIALATSAPEAAKYLDGMQVVKTIAIPKRIVNIVVKPQA